MTRIMHCEAEKEYYSTNSHSESYIKEEIMIPDLTDCFDDETLTAVNKTSRSDQIPLETLGKVTYKEQNWNQDERNSDEEIDVINVDQRNEKLFFEAHKNWNILEDIGPDNMNIDTFDDNTIRIDECSMEIDVDVTSDEESVNVDEFDYIDETYVQNDTKENMNLVVKKSEEQITMPNFFKKSSESRKLSSITNSTPKVVAEKSAKTTLKAFKVTGSEIYTKQHSTGIECSTCGNKFKSKDILRKHKEACNINVYYLRCTFCPFKTKYKYSILNHVKKVHKNVKSQNYVSVIKKIIEEGEKIKANALNSADDTEVNTKSRPKAYKTFIQLFCTKCDKICENMDYSKDRNCQKCGTAMLLQCVKCTERFPEIRTMYAHLYRKCAARNQYQCAHCDYKATTKCYLEKHIHHKHSIVAPENYERCSKCGKQYKFQMSRLKHEKRCGAEAVLQCPYCLFKGKDKPYFELHVQDHILFPTAKVMQTPIPVGGARIKAKASKPLNKDEKLKLEKLTKAFCLKCDKSVKYVSQDKNQCSECKMKLTYPCSKCDNVYTQFYHLRLHVINNHLNRKTKERLQCSTCGKMFSLNKYLQQHEDYCAKEPNIQCKHCHFKTKYLRSFALHMKRKHSKTKAVAQPATVDAPKKFVCEQCGRGYATNNNLKRHRNYYCGKQPTFACNHCSHKDYAKYLLLIHLKRKHTHLFTRQELWCRHCGKASTNVYTHNIHVADCRFK